MENENKQGQSTAELETAKGEQGNPTSEQQKTNEITFTQDQVNEMVQERLSKVYKKCGVNNAEELDSYVKKAKEYDDFKKSYDSMVAENKALKEEKIFKDNNIEEKKIEDVKIYFKGKDMDLTDENLKSVLETHPEWVAKVSSANFGATKGDQKQPDEEKKLASKLFGGLSF